MQEVILGRVVGRDGTNGREIEMRASSTAIQQRYVGETTWHDVVLLSAITGPQGIQGVNGKKLMLQKSSTHIQFKYESDTMWTNLVALADIKGDTGQTGATGQPGAKGADGSPGSQIRYGSGVPATTLGAKGDTYINTSSNLWDTYYKSADNRWDKMGYLKGEQGGPGGDTLPIGAMLPSNSKTSKDGWLVCDGSLISRATYSELFAVIGTRYGAGNGTTTFALPNGPDLVAHSVDAKGVSHLEPLASGTCMIIKAKQLVPIVASVIDDINSTSNTDALSVKGVKSLMDKRALSYIKVPTKYTVNQFNIVFHNNPIDVNTLCDGCRHRVPSGSANLPVDGYCYIDSIVADTGYGYQYAHLTRGNQVYMREYCANVFSGWQLISGQVVLWSGNAQAKDTVLTSSSDISMYGHVNVITGDGWALDGVVHGNSLIMASVSYAGASGAIITGCVTLQIVDNKHLKLYSNVSELSNTTSDHTIASKQHITTIIGRP